MAMLFDGKKFALELELQLKKRIADLPRTLKLVTILDPQNAGAVTYTNLKEKAAKRLGVEFVRIENSDFDIQKLNADPSVDGIMLQLPYPNSQVIINHIDPQKDVDGLRSDSAFLPAAVVAVIKILPKDVTNILVIGSQGSVGRRLVQELGAQGMDKEDFDTEKIRLFDTVVSATGHANLITPDMVKPGVVAIDLGYPKGDFDPRVADTASLFTPVPGGVGPVTVISLFENLVDSNHG